MSDMYFNKNAGKPQKPVRKNDGYDEVFEDISSFSENYVEDEFEDISSGQDMFDDSRRRTNRERTNRERANHSRAQRPSSQREVSMQKRRRNPDIGIEDIESGKPKKKKGCAARALKIGGICLLVFVCIVGIVFFSLMNKLNKAEDPDHVNQFISDEELYSDKNVTNILLLGVDAREGETASRSDTMMLISLDKNNKKIKMTSFLRDSYVEIPGHGWNKLNAACQYGGIDLVRDTIEYNFKIKIDNYMKVDFEAFEELINALGGVNVEVTEKEANYLNATWNQWSLTGNELHFDSGDAVHLDGEQALMYCRIRKLDSDFYRTERQRKTISAVKQELMHTNPVELVKIANNVLPLIETDISSSSMTKLCLEALTSYLKYDMVSQGIPADGTWKSKNMKPHGDCLVFDIDQTAEFLKDYIYKVQ